MNKQQSRFFTTIQIYNFHFPDQTSEIVQYALMTPSESIVKSGLKIDLSQLRVEFELSKHVLFCPHLHMYFQTRSNILNKDCIVYQSSFQMT